MINLKVIICGYKGKMGNLIYQRLVKNSNYQVVGLVDLDTVPLKDLLKQDVDAVVDFTNAGCAIENAYLCLENNINYLSGTTGISESVIRKIGRIAKRKKLSFIICPNFSIGINLLLKSLSLIRPYFDNVEIIEQHHISKIDKPSGTALAIKRYLNEDDIIIKSIRKDSNVLYHKIILKKNDEELEIMHKTTSRNAYIEGVLYSLSRLNTFKGLKRTINF